MNTAGVHAHPGLSRLVAVELRKIVNARAGFWLVATVALWTLLPLLIGVWRITRREVAREGLSPSAVIGLRDARPRELDEVAGLLAEVYAVFAPHFPAQAWKSYIGEIVDVRSRLGESELIVASRGGLLVMVNVAPEFNQTPLVTNGYSDLILDLCGPEVGMLIDRHGAPVGRTRALRGRGRDQPVTSAAAARRLRKQWVGNHFIAGVIG